MARKIFDNDNKKKGRENFFEENIYPSIRVENINRKKKACRRAMKVTFWILNF